MSLDAFMMQFVGRVQQLSATADAAGGIVNVWNDVFSPVFARIEVASGNVIDRFARRFLEVSHELFSSTAGIRGGMRFVTDAGIIYSVVAEIDEPGTGNIQTYYHFVANEVRPLIEN